MLHGVNWNTLCLDIFQSKSDVHVQMMIFGGCLAFVFITKLYYGISG